jgi:thymidine kinase
MSYTKETSYLEIILGGMYAGKTSRLVEIYKQCQFCDIEVTVINHSIDNRYDNNLLSTHDKVKIPCIKTEFLMDLCCKTEDKVKLEISSVILINEGQFFSDLIEFVSKMLLNNKKR